MDNNLVTKSRKKRVVHRRHLAGRRVLALLLTLTMVLTSSGMQIQAVAGDSSSESETVTEEMTPTEDAQVEETGQVEESAPAEDAALTEESAEAQPTEDADQAPAAEEAEPTATAAEETAQPSEAPEEDTSVPVEATASEPQADGLNDTGDGNIDLENYLTPDSTMEIAINGVYYTLDEIQAKGLKVPSGAPVKVALHFGSITGIKAGQKLVYQIDPSMVSSIHETKNGRVLEPNANGIKVVAGYFDINQDGSIVVSITDDYFNSNLQLDGTLTLVELNISFSGNLSTDHGEHSGNGDNVIRFKGTTEGEYKDPVEFTIPFEYKNENGKVTVEKTSEFDPATRTIHYTVKVQAPETNTMTAEKVSVTDTIANGQNFLVPINEGSTIYYNNVKTYFGSTETSGQFDASTGVWTIGDMEPGETATLTYDIQVDSTFYTDAGAPDAIHNEAAATFNPDNAIPGTASASNDEPCKGAVLITKSVSKSGSDSAKITVENGVAYLTYTLTVIAPDADVPNVTVTDQFTSGGDNITGITLVDGSPSQQGPNGVTISGSSLTWDVGELKEGQSATLTYKAAINSSAWPYGQSYWLDPYGTKFLTFDNSATVQVGDTPYGSSQVQVKAYKTWLNKYGSKMTTGSKSGMIKFTVTANNDPVVDYVNYITDTLSSGGTYETDGVITLTRYDSSSTRANAVTYTVKLSDVLNDAGNSWTIYLDRVPTQESGTVDLAGPYYYELYYYVTPTSQSVRNGAGIGLGVGDGLVLSKVVESAGTDFNYSKKLMDYDISHETSTWQIKINTNVPKGAQYWDSLSNEYVYSWTYSDKANSSTAEGRSYSGFWWFTEQDLKNIKLNVMKTENGTTTVDRTLNGTVVLTNKNVGDYSSEVDAVLATVDNIDQYDYVLIGYWNPGYSSWDPAGENGVGSRFCQYLVYFVKEVSGLSSSNYLTIDYNVTLNRKGMNSNLSDGKGWMGANLTNYYQWFFNRGTSEEAKLPGDRNQYTWNWQNRAAMTKAFGKLNGSSVDASTGYNKEDGTLTWTLTLNRESSLSGDMDLEEWLPEGLEFVSATITSRNSKAESENTSFRVGTDDDGNPIYSQTITADQVAITADQTYPYDDSGDTMTKVVLPLANLSAGPYKYNSDGSVAQTNQSSWVSWGTFTVEVTAKLTNEAKLAVSDTEYTNKAVLVSKDQLVNGYFEATSTGTVPGNTVSKTSNYTKPYMQYTLDINPDGIDLMQGDDLTADDHYIVVKDTMGAGMCLATELDNYITVTDEDGNPVDYTLTDSTQKGGDSPYFELKLPDNVHVTVKYYVSFEGAIGDNVTLNNTASFEYEGRIITCGGGENETKIVVEDADADASTLPYFGIRKTNQYGAIIPGVAFTLYEVPLDSNGVAQLDDDDLILVDTETTGPDGMLYFQGLDKTKIYCYVETAAPDGYALSGERSYVEFQHHENSGIHDIADIVEHGAVRKVENTFQGASLTIPVQKLINNQNMNSEEVFTFNLYCDEDPTGIYVDEEYTKPLGDSTISTTITGTGFTQFEPLYFNAVGTYSFRLTEADLTADQTANGFAKDTAVYILTVTVAADATTNALKVTHAYYERMTTSPAADAEPEAHSAFTDIIYGFKPCFFNTLTLDGTLTLTAHKDVSGRRLPVAAGEFTFIVSDDGEEVGEFTTKEGGDIDITIPLTADDLGDHIYVIQEKAGTDPTIEYTDEAVVVSVHIEAESGELKATSIEYLTDTGTGLFTNKYKASGELTLEATKSMPDREKPVYAGEFTFVVKEGSTVVSTGTTRDGGAIEFEPIKYVTSDIGEHTYVISEEKGYEIFVGYTAEPVTVKVTVADADNGQLSATVDYPEGGIQFVNDYYYTPSVGVFLDIMPYAAAIIVAGGVGAAFLVRRRRRRDA
jgi:pilin isopeptide linkage protein